MANLTEAEQPSVDIETVNHTPMVLRGEFDPRYIPHGMEKFSNGCPWRTRRVYPRATNVPYSLASQAAEVVAYCVRDADRLARLPAHLREFVQQRTEWRHQLGVFPTVRNWYANGVMAFEVDTAYQLTRYYDPLSRKVWTCNGRHTIWRKDGTIAEYTDHYADGSPKHFRAFDHRGGLTKDTWWTAQGTVTHETQSTWDRPTVISQIKSTTVLRYENFSTTRVYALATFRAILISRSRTNTSDKPVIEREYDGNGVLLLLKSWHEGTQHGVTFYFRDRARRSKSGATLWRNGTAVKCITVPRITLNTAPYYTGPLSMREDALTILPADVEPINAEFATQERAILDDLLRLLEDRTVFQTGRPQ